jgi:hypothetical protein
MAVIFDAHVHIYSIFDLAKMVHYAHANFTRLLKIQGVDPAQCTRLLCLGERAGQNFFAEAISGSCQIEGCCVTPLKGALRVEFARAPRLYVLPGRQVACAERVELHALCTEARFTDGAPLRAAIAAANEASAVTVLPWGVGKWLGQRGEFLKQVLKDNAGLCVSDSALRPWPILRSPLLKMGRCMLAGTDPLPFAGEERRIGSYATLFAGDFDEDSPLEECRRMLSSTREGDFKVLGRRLNMVQVAAKMVALRCGTVFKENHKAHV